MSFRPDLADARTIEKAIEDLTKIAEKLAPASPRACKISEMIRDLQNYENERRAPPHARQT